MNASFMGSQEKMMNTTLCISITFTLLEAVHKCRYLFRGGVSQKLTKLGNLKTKSLNKGEVVRPISKNKMTSFMNRHLKTQTSYAQKCFNTF